MVAPGNTGESPLICAACGDHLAVVETLVVTGANIRRVLMR